MAGDSTLETLDLTLKNISTFYFTSWLYHLCDEPKSSKFRPCVRRAAQITIWILFWSFFPAFFVAFNVVDGYFSAENENALPSTKYAKHQ